MIGIIFTVILTGVIVYVFLLDGNKDKLSIKKEKRSKTEADKKTKIKKEHAKNMYSSQDRINIKKIKSIGDGEDSSLIIKDNNTYIGILEIYGVNYNLLSSQERLVLEEAFQIMINGLEYPIQFFVQSRRIDIENYKNIYNNRLQELRDGLKQEKNKLVLQTANNELFAKEMSEIENNVFRLENQINYGEQVVEFISSFASHSNILEKRYYIAVSYAYTGDTEDENEKFITAYNTIANRANSILTALSRGNVSGKILNGFELSELLYVSYNKKDSNKYKFDKALETKFNNYIVTSRPVEFKMLELKEEEIEKLISA